MSPERPGALLLIDIDNFKLVNDQYGHTAGDRLLIALSEMIRSVLPRNALAARLGGDEFVILLNNASSERIVELGNALREQFLAMASQTFPTPAAGHPEHWRQPVRQPARQPDGADRAR